MTGAARAGPPSAAGACAGGGTCVRVRRGGTPVALACLARDLGRARLGAPLRWAADAGGPAGAGRCPASLVVRIHGLRVALRATTREALAALCARLPPGWRPTRARTVDRVYSLVAPRRRGFRTLYVDTDRIGRGRRGRAILDSFEASLQIYVAEQARRGVFVHAGVVAWKGRALVLPGRSGAGKTTLVAELLRAGARYYSDEYAVLDDGGRVHPYARPLSIRTGGLRRRRCVPEALGARGGRRALPVGLVVASRYRPGGGWRLRRLSAGEGALALMANTVSARREPARALAALQAVVVRAPVLRGLRGEARPAARALLARLEALTRGAARGENGARPRA